MDTTTTQEPNSTESSSTLTHTQTNPELHPNQQDPATLLAPESAPDHHKTYYDRKQDTDEEPPVTGLYPPTTEGENADAPPAANDGSGSERWGASDWTAAKGEGLDYPS